MAKVDALEIPDNLFAYIEGVALSHSRSVNDQIVTLLQFAVEAGSQQQRQANVLQEINQTRWTPPDTAPDSTVILREIRGYHE